MEIVLIVGRDGAGKSTLVRGLCGVRDGRNIHPHSTNVVVLKHSDGFEHRTFLTVSSINEADENDRYEFEKDKEYENGRTVAPWHLRDVLDKYSQKNSETACSKAILCINTNVATQGWTLNDYAAVINDPTFSHTITHTVRLAVGNPPTINPAATFQNVPDKWFYRGNPATPRNQVAADVRNHIGLI